jgi:hypothetical protein
VEEPTAPDRHWLWPVSVIGMALLLLVTAAGGSLLVLGQQRQVRALEQDLARTQSELTEVRAELAEARADGGGDPDSTPAPEGLGGLLEGLLEGLGGEGGTGLLDGLLDGLGGDLDGLLGGEGQAALLACLSGAMAPEGSVRPIPDGSASEQVAAIAERVEELRGLTFPDDVATRFLPGPEFEAEVRERFDADYRPADAELDERTLAALGAIPADFDLRERYLDLISGQAAGFYTTDTQEIVVRADDPDAALSPAEQVTLAHELEHALSDAVLGIPDLADTDDGDAARAALALVEGGATLAMQQFAGTSLGPMAQLRMGMDPAIAESQAQLETFPHHLQRELVFPYETGLAFACGLHADGGWDAVDAAYADLPTTTAEILWPQRYGQGGGPGAGDLTFSATPTGFEDERTTTFGAAELLWLLEAPGGDPEAAPEDARARAAAWDGGTLRLLTRGADTAVGLAIAQRPGEPDLCESLASWYRGAFPGQDGTAQPGERLVRTGGGQTGVLRCGTDAVRLGIGPDADAARDAAR